MKIQSGEIIAPQCRHLIVFLLHDFFQAYAQGVAQGGEIKQVLAHLAYYSLPAVFAKLSFDMG